MATGSYWENIVEAFGVELVWRVFSRSDHVSLVVLMGSAASA